jgi:hypothetical protein
VNQTWHWIDWLDILQKDDEKEQKTKSQLPSFLEQYPGFEVNNGVVRGGTFVLVYNAQGTIVGTGMLSHYIPIPIAQTPVKPELPKYELPLNTFPLPGIQIKPSFEFEVDRKLADFGNTFTKQIDIQLANNTSYLDAFKDSISIVKDFNFPTKTVLPGMMASTDVTKDVAIDQALASMASSNLEITLLNNQIAKASTPEEQQIYVVRKAKMEEKVADDIYYVANYANNKKDMSSDTSNQIIKLLSVSGLSVIDNTIAIGRVKSFMAENKDSPFTKNLKQSLGDKFVP